MKEIQSLPASVEHLMKGAERALAKSNRALADGDPYEAQHHAQNAMAQVAKIVEHLAAKDPYMAMAAYARHTGARSMRLTETFEDEHYTIKNKEFLGIRYGADIQRTTTKRTHTKRIDFID